MRLDQYLAGRGFTSRTKAARAVAEGKVLLNGKPAKASDSVDENDRVEIAEVERGFVSEGGYKLQKALDDFHADVRGKVFADLGASTGGFTDCLLQAGAARVFAIDVGCAQLDASLASDPRVCAMDKINVRYLRREDIPAERLDGVTADLSFISLTYILPIVASILPQNGDAFLLIKPQFECGGVGLDKHGILKDKNKRLSIVLELAQFSAQVGLRPVNVTAAPVKPRKNVEYILHCIKAEGDMSDAFQTRIAALD